MIFNMGGGGVVPKYNKDAEIITPGTSDQVIPVGTYMRGDLTIAGDADLIPENIKFGANIFGVDGTFGGLVKIDGSFPSEEMNLVSKIKDFNVSTLPYNFVQGCAVLYKNQVHILGGTGGTFHYKWNGSSWVSVSTLPYSFKSGSAVVYNNQIHILGGTDTKTYHYKWNGSSWESVSTLPYNFCYGSAVIYNNQIHILGSSYAELSHYKWDGSSWTSLGNMGIRFQRGSAVVYKNEIHILGSYNSSNGLKHYKWNGSSWESVSTLPHGYSVYDESAVVFDGAIHILGGASSPIQTKHYKWDGSSWTELSELPYNFYFGCSLPLNNLINIFGSAVTANVKRHYELQRKIYMEV